MDADVMTHARKARQQPPPSTPSQLKFLTRKETARELRVSLATLDRIIGRGQLKAKKHGHSTFVMTSEIDRYIENWPDIEPRAERAAR
jgi:hypothetical protein